MAAALAALIAGRRRIWRLIPLGVRMDVREWRSVHTYTQTAVTIATTAGLVPDVTAMPSTGPRKGADSGLGPECAKADQMRTEAGNARAAGRQVFAVKLNYSAMKVDFSGEVADWSM